MVTQSDILARRPAISERFRFTLLYYGSVTILSHAPDGFANGKLKISRNKTYRGLFRTISVSELVFYKEAVKILRDIFDVYGIDSEVLLKIELNSTTGYVDYFTLKLDFATYKETDISVTLQAVDSSFAETVKNREDLKVNLFSTTSVDGDTITDFDSSLNLIDTSIDNNANWNGNGINPVKPGWPTLHNTPFILTDSDFSEAVTPTQDIDQSGSFFKSNTFLRKFAITGNIQGEIDFFGGYSITLQVEFKLNIYDENNNLKTTYGLHSDSFTGIGGLSFNFNISETITLPLGYSMSITGSWNTNGADINDFWFKYTLLALNVNESYTGLFAKTIKAFEIYEAFLRIVQLITGKDDCLLSTKFGRTDTPFRTYPSDGVLMHLTKGRLLREIVATLPASLKTLFESVNSVYNIGLAFENEQVRIEGIDYFFQNAITLDLSSRITADILTREAAPDKIYKQIEIGFSKFGNDKSDTDDISWTEFNTKATYSTQVKAVTTSLVMLSQIRADGTAIVRLANDLDLSREASGDNDLFFLKSVRDTSGFKIATNEGYTLIDGSPFAEKSLNLDLSPARSLHRWGNVIKAGTNWILRWQNTDNNYKLSTQKTGESVITEDADIDTSIFTKLFTAERYVFKSFLTQDEINVILAGINGLIRISDTKTGWIDEMTINNENGEVEFKLIRND